MDPDDCGCDCLDTFDCHGKHCSAGDPPPPDTADAIVRDLANCDPVIWGDIPDPVWCVLCGAEFPAGTLATDFTHAPECPYKRAATITPVAQ